MEGRKSILIIGLLLGSISLVFAQGMESFDAANKAYNEGKFQEAVNEYQKIIAHGAHSFEVYFNLGNAYYKLNDVANSIYFYEKAALINKDHPSLQVNLAYARQMTIDAINQKRENGLSTVVNGVIQSVPLSTWTLLSILFMLLFVVSYLIFLFWNTTKIKRLAFGSSLILIVLSLSTYALAYQHQALEAQEAPAIIFENTIVKAEPNERGAKLFELHLGTKVQVQDQMGEWAQVQLADGQQGWLLQQSIKPIK